MREVTRRQLARQGYTVITAANSYQGTIDLLLTDVIMPQMLGRKAAGGLICANLSLDRHSRDESGQRRAMTAASIEDGEWV